MIFIQENAAFSQVLIHQDWHDQFLNTINFILLLNFKESFINYLILGAKVADFSERSSRRFSAAVGAYWKHWFNISLFKQKVLQKRVWNETPVRHLFRHCVWFSTQSVLLVCMFFLPLIANMKLFLPIKVLSGKVFLWKLSVFVDHDSCCVIFEASYESGLLYTKLSFIYLTQQQVLHVFELCRFWYSELEKKMQTNRKRQPILYSWSVHIYMLFWVLLSTT